MTKKYDLDFKLNAVQLIKEQKLSILQVSKDLGIAKSTLHKWVTALEKYPSHPAFPGKGGSNGMEPSMLIRFILVVSCLAFDVKR